MTHSTKVARRRGYDRKRYDQDNVIQETRTPSTSDNTSMFLRNVGMYPNFTVLQPKSKGVPVLN
jgi:hypothetical protein